MTSAGLPAAERGRPVDPTVLRALSAGEVRLNAFVLPAELARPDYLAVDRVLRAAGGRWDKRARGHVFTAGDAGEAIDAILSTGFVVDRRQALGAFYTPSALAERLVAEANVRPGQRVLEPSVGHGAIVAATLAAGATAWGYEVDPAACAAARHLFTEGALYQRDFLQAEPAPVFDRAVMNPPFARQADVRHVRHALACLRPGGRLVSVMSAGTLDRADRTAIDFRDLVHGLGGRFERLPDDSFAAAGTRVRTVLVAVDKPKGAIASGRGAP